MTAIAQPLSGIRVLDMTTLAMGPLATQILGEYGADVIKVEPIAGDPFRATLPTVSRGMGHTFLQLNRNKRSLAIDLKVPAARAAFGQLIARADVFVSNVRPAGMAGLGLDYAAVQAVNPGIIYCAAYGFSEQGPYAGRPAADDTIQAMSGLVNLNGRATQGTPQFAASVVADKAVGLTLANAIMAALIQRMRGGQGQFLEVPMFESMVAFVLPEHLAGNGYVPARGPSGYGRIVTPMRRPFATADGYLCVLPYTLAQWQAFFRLIGREDLAVDPELADPVKRNARTPELYGMIAAAMPARTTKAWAADLLAADILFGEVLGPEELLDDPHLEVMGMFPEFKHPSEGRIRLIAPPVQSSLRAAQVRLLPPLLGQHSREVLESVGLAAGDIAALIAAGAIIDAGDASSDTRPR